MAGLSVVGQGCGLVSWAAQKVVFTGSSGCFLGKMASGMPRSTTSTGALDGLVEGAGPDFGPPLVFLRLVAPFCPME